MECLGEEGAEDFAQANRFCFPIKESAGMVRRHNKQSFFVEWGAMLSAVDGS